MITAVEVTVTAPVVSFRNPLYAAVQVGLPCPPPATVGGMLADARGGWPRVDRDTRFAMAFRAGGGGTDLETYHPLSATGKGTDPTPRDRDFLADATLTVWLLADTTWIDTLRRPVWPLHLGRSQDLVGIQVRTVVLSSGSGHQGHALLPAGVAQTGTLLQLPTAIALERTRTRWDTYRYAPWGAHDQVGDDTTWCAPDGQAVIPLPPTHPDHATSPHA